ncbi:MAG TPA: phosphoglucosamine mutase [Thermoplasmata archaeon]|jgi:phosphomannomutase/phosphoglucomutase|nr:phosphoglucosamine mutase [Thermoplasmata archaeon]
MRLFGTNGIRGVVGKDLTPELAVRVARAVATVWGPKTLAVGRDTRSSGPMLRGAVVSGLLASGAHVVDLGVLPTPAAQYYVKERGLAGGIVVTASHNPPEWNGIKVVDEHGMEIPREVEEKIEALVASAAFASPAWRDVGSVATAGDGPDLYVRGVAAKVDRAAIAKRHLHVVVDPGNGAACVTTPFLLRQLGCRVTTINAQPDGAFPGRNPEPTAENLASLRALVPALHADVGIAHDGDADRAAIIDERGEFVDGDRLLALLAGDVVRRTPGLVVTPVSSSSCVEDVVRAAGGRLEYTKVGAPLVARAIYGKGAVFGGEENGGMIFPGHLFARDGGMTAAKVVELLAVRDEPFSALLSEIPRYYLRKVSVPCPKERRETVMARLRELSADRRVDATDGLKVYGEGGWVLLRPSGTEAILRVYAEGKTAEQAAVMQKFGEELVARALAT